MERDYELWEVSPELVAAYQKVRDHGRVPKGAISWKQLRRMRRLKLVRQRAGMVECLVYDWNPVVRSLIAVPKK